MPALAPHPVRKRPAIMRPAELPTGHSEFQTTYQALQASQTGLRPYISERAAITKGPTPNPSIYMENETCAVEGSMFRSREMAGSAAAVMLALMSVTNCPADTTMTMVILRQGDQL